LADARAPAGAPDLPTLTVREAYRLWAPVYDRENAVTSLEDRLVRAVSPRAAGRALLDAGCGTGRRLPTGARSPRLAVGVDLVPAMLRRSLTRARRGPLLACADARSLPLRAARFDLLWLRFVTGHLRDLEEVYRELRRVASTGARLVVSDFHPAAVAAGHRRTFRDSLGRVLAVEHHAHGVTDHERAARAAGWVRELMLEAPAGLPERPYYVRAGRLEQFERERALPLVLVMCFH